MVLPLGILDYKARAISLQILSEGHYLVRAAWQPVPLKDPEVDGGSGKQRGKPEGPPGSEGTLYPVHHADTPLLVVCMDRLVAPLPPFLVVIPLWCAASYVDKTLPAALIGPTSSKSLT
ncbi:hypothetical protein CIHG_04217 [Coccidioides immitis H538.4]|uniref:Uncharacterized protein n=3 Tax=Coccidioides immitis TaxID=5501 RepID=A0A0J8R088_COCIT|nr:hypothetical protein CIRG_04607 [Coccidioides immitis RMSCC 2394]KMU78121.1 hypothetical protein CISG_06962 [Coccidioides immitis RMSCC 3703]KMU86428.1 hypothetical protein CIHG_04217 [Coccidioides immitis H538.4]